MLMSLFQGNFRVLFPLLPVVSVSYASGALATSLYGGRGVPWWFLRAFRLSSMIGIAFLFSLEIRNFPKGVPIDLVSDLLMFGTATYFWIFSRQIFWNPISK